MSASFDQSPDRHTWTFESQPVTQVCVDRTSCRVESWTLQASLEIRFGATFGLALADGTSRDIDPDAPEQVAPMLTLIGRRVMRLVVHKAGSLELALSDGSVLTAAPHARYEAFEINGAGALEGMHYRSRPGGGIPWDV